MHRSSLLLILALTSSATAGCGNDGRGPVSDSSAGDGATDVGPGDVGADSGDANTGDSALDDTGPPPPFELTTTAFSEGEVIPLRYECGGSLDGPGENISPPLAWTTGAAGTMSYAIIMDDVDSGVVHWVIYDIPADVRSLAEGFPAGYEPATPAGAKQAEIQGSGYFGYFGPCSPAAINTYRWTIHAIGTLTVTGATMTTTEYDMVGLIQAESLGSASFSGES